MHGIMQNIETVGRFCLEAVYLILAPSSNVQCLKSHATLQMVHYEKV